MFHIWIILFSVAVAGTFIAEKIKQPYPTLLVIIGLVIGLLPIKELESFRTYATNDVIFQTIIIMVFLSALLGDASLKMPFSELKENRKPILLLSILATILTFIVIAVGSYWVLGLSIQQSLLFGSLMSATDPVSVLSIFKTMGLNKRLSMIVEGESLANDGVAVVLFKIALITTTISVNGILNASTMFLKVIIGSIIIGLLLGFLASRITAKIDQHLIEIALSIVLFYGTFEIAEMFHFSGVVAVVMSGLVLGNYGKKFGMSDLTLERMDDFWETVAFIGNSVIFLMVGLEVANIPLSNQSLITIALSVIVVIVARLMALFVSLYFDKTIPSSWKLLMTWGGLKGSLSIALILSVAPTFPGRDLILTITFSNVLFSLLVQGVTLKKMVKLLNVK
jgi:NhaP-type Na+/H+ and K+/H+ antiporters